MTWHEKIQFMVRHDLTCAVAGILDRWVEAAVEPPLPELFKPRISVLKTYSDVEVSSFVKYFYSHLWLFCGRRLKYFPSNVLTFEVWILMDIAPEHILNIFVWKSSEKLSKRSENGVCLTWYYFTVWPNWKPPKNSGKKQFSKKAIDGFVQLVLLTIEIS